VFDEREVICPLP